MVIHHKGSEYVEIVIGYLNAKEGTEKVDDVVGEYGPWVRNEREEKLFK